MSQYDFSHIINITSCRVGKGYDECEHIIMFQWKLIHDQLSTCEYSKIRVKNFGNFEIKKSFLESYKKKLEKKGQLGSQLPRTENGTLSTGVSINAIFNVVFADSFKSEQIIIQSIGRALRKHEQKQIATIFDIVDIFNPSNMNNILYNHYRERQKFYLKRKYPFKEIKMNLQ